MKNWTHAALCGAGALWLALTLAACAPAAQPGAAPVTAPEAAQQPSALPNLVPSDVLIPFPIDEEPISIAVVSVLVSDTLQLDTQNSGFVTGYGSDVARLRGGSLTLELMGEDGPAFNLAVEDPRAVHVYDTADLTLPHADSLVEPALLLDDTPIEWSFLLPIEGEYYDSQINRLNLRQPNGDLIFSAGIDLEANSLAPYDLVYPEPGSYSQPGEIPIENPTSEQIRILVNQIMGEAGASATVSGSGSGQAAIAVDSGTINVAAPDSLARIGMRIEPTGAAGAEAPSVGFVVDGSTYQYTLAQLQAGNGQTFVLDNGAELYVAASTIDGSTLLDIQSANAVLDQMMVSGAGYQISEIAVQTGP